MFDLYADEGARTLDKAAAHPSLQPEPGFFDGGLDLTMEGFAKTARQIDLIGSVAPIVMDKLTGGTTYQDQYFKEHDDVFNRAVDYWTPTPGTVGKAGQVIGGLVPVIGQVLINPALAIGTAGLGAGEDLIRQGVDSIKAVPAAIAQAAGMGVGIAMPIFGSTWATRALVAGAGANVVQGIATKAVMRQILKGEKSADQYDPWDLEGIVLDTLMGVAFGSLTHLGAKAQEARDAMTQSDRDALLVAQQARHMEDTTAPGKPDDPMSATAHVEAVKKAADDLLAGRPVNVDQIVQDARFSPEKPDTVIHDEMVRVAPNAEPQIEPLVRDERLAIELRGAQSGQNDLTLSATAGEKTIGRIDYSEYQGRPAIQMIEVAPEFRRRGVATRMLQELQRQYPDEEINWGSLTEEGAALKGAVPTKPKPNIDVIAQQVELAAVREKLATYARMADELSAKPQKTDAEIKAFEKTTADWNALSDREFVLEEATRGKKAETTLIDTEAAKPSPRGTEPPDPLLAEARQRVAVHGEIEVPTGAIDENGKPVTRKLGEMYDEAVQRTAQAKADVNLFTVAAQCMLGGL